MSEHRMTATKQQAYDQYCEDLAKLGLAEDCVRRSITMLIEKCKVCIDPAVESAALLLEHNLKAEANLRSQAAESVRVFFDTV